MIGAILFFIYFNFYFQYTHYCAYKCNVLIFFFLTFRGDITMGTAIFFTCTAVTWLKYCQYSVNTIQLINQSLHVNLYILGIFLSSAGKLSP